MCLPGEWWWVRALLAEYQHKSSPPPWFPLPPAARYSSPHLCSVLTHSHLIPLIFSSGSAAPVLFSIFFLFLLWKKRTSSKHNSAGVYVGSLHTHQVEEGEGVIAVCRWRACGSCWLWRLLYVRGWTKRRIGAPLWPCCSESRPLSRSHKLAWLELDCGLRAPDHDLPRPLVLQKRKKKNTHKACECWLDSCFTEHAWGNHKFTLRVVTWMWITTDLLLWKHVYFKRGPLKANSSASAAKCQARQPWGKTRGTLTYNNRKSAEWKTGSNLNVTCSFPVKSVCVCV